MTSVQLNQTAQVTTQFTGSGVITFPPARLNRTLQGTVSLLGGTPGTAWSVLVGGLSVGTLFAPGPFGPVQILSGQSLSLVCAAGLANQTTYTAVLQGIDDPASVASSYTGPIIPPPNFSGNQGGISSYEGGGTGGYFNIAGALASNLAYRLKAVSFTSQGVLATANSWVGLFGSVSALCLSTVTSGFPLAQTFDLDSILDQGPIEGYVDAAGWPASTTISAIIRFDVVSIT